MATLRLVTRMLTLLANYFDVSRGRFLESAFPNVLAFQGDICEAKISALLSSPAESLLV
jgi:hypothetical protein